MVDKILKNLHVIIIAYAFFISYTAYTEFEEQLENKGNKIGPLKSKIKKAERKLSEIENFKSTIDDYQSQIQAIKGQIEELKRKLPTDAERTVVLEELKAEASQLNLKEISFKPKYKESRGVYLANGIEINGIGTYLQFLIFFERMARSNRIINVKEVLIKEPKDIKNRGRFHLVDSKITIETFQYNENFREPKPEKKNNATQRRRPRRKG
jgi:Tfp pilus assembly protein PilO